MTVTTQPVGALIRQWRQRRRLSQLDLSLATGVSARHLSFVETGRSSPSREMIERLCGELDIPLRERNILHLAAGFAPPYSERSLTDLAAARLAVDGILRGLEPNPAVAVDVGWNLIAANRAAGAFLGGAAGIPSQGTSHPPLNMLRMTLAPDGLAPQIRNLARWRTEVLRRLHRQLERTADPGLADLIEEILDYPAPADDDQGDRGSADDLVVPLQLTTEHGELRLLYTTTVFGSPRDVTLDEIAIETFFPADDHTARVLRSL
jgi:transcriptional regulator with XRE-family HTH domain